MIKARYERDGEIVVPAGTKAIGEPQSANRSGLRLRPDRGIQWPDPAEKRRVRVETIRDQHKLARIEHSDGACSGEFLQGRYAIVSAIRSPTPEVE